MELPSLRSAIAGTLGGMAMGGYEMLATWSIGPGPLAPLELIGATHPFAGIHPALVGAAMHMITAAFWGTRFGHIMETAPPRLLRLPGGILTGLAWGASVWVVMGKVVGPLLNVTVQVWTAGELGRNARRSRRDHRPPES